MKTNSFFSLIWKDNMASLLSYSFLLFCHFLTYLRIYGGEQSKAGFFISKYEIFKIFKWPDFNLIINNRAGAGKDIYAVLPDDQSVTHDNTNPHFQNGN